MAVDAQFKGYCYPMKAQVLTSGTQSELKADDKYKDLATPRDMDGIQYLLFVPSIDSYVYAIATTESDPNTNDVVLVLFESGDARFPVIIGTLNGDGASIKATTMEES